MQRSTVLILMLVAFFLGALADRIYNWTLAINGPPSDAALMTPPTDTNATQPGGFTLNACLSSAQRRGMTRDQASRACREIMD